MKMLFRHESKAENLVILVERLVIVFHFPFRKMKTLSFRFIEERIFSELFLQFRNHLPQPARKIVLLARDFVQLRRLFQTTLPNCTARFRRPVLRLFAKKRLPVSCLFPRLRPCCRASPSCTVFSFRQRETKIFSCKKPAQRNVLLMLLLTTNTTNDEHHVLRFLRFHCNTANQPGKNRETLFSSFSSLCLTSKAAPTCPFSAAFSSQTIA
jgi:hypothetical protein